MSTLRVRSARDVKGLPGPLPIGETLLWQGAPDWRVLRVRAFHLRIVAGYFAVILAWNLVSSLSAGTAAGPAALSLLRLTGLALVPIVLLLLYTWSIGRSTTYTITSKRVAISFGLVVPVTFNLPYHRIEGANLHEYPGGAGDIALTLSETERLAYLVIWPHARPWRMARAEPMLRCIPDAARVAGILGTALASHAATEAAANQACLPDPVDVAGEVGQAAAQSGGGPARFPRPDAASGFVAQAA